MDNYRTVLEVLKFLPPKQALESPCSRCWQRVCDSSELWQLQLDLELTFPMPPSPLSPKSRYRKLSSSRVTRHLVRPTQLSAFNCKTETWQATISLSETIKCDLSSGLACLYDCRLFVCGGGEEISTAWNSAYLVSENGAVQAVEPMKEERTFPGMVAISEWVYVFGGRSRHTVHRSAVRCQGEGWEALGSMITPRSLFNPCFDGRKVYLCGGEAQEIELFDVSSRLFSQLSVQLPYHSSVSAVYVNNSVMLLTPTRVFVLENSKKTLTSCFEINFNIVWGSECAYIDKKYVYLPWGQVMQQFSRSSWQRKLFYAGKSPLAG